MNTPFILLVVGFVIFLVSAVFYFLRRFNVVNINDLWNNIIFYSLASLAFVLYVSSMFILAHGNVEKYFDYGVGNEKQWTLITQGLYFLIFVPFVLYITPWDGPSVGNFILHDLWSLLILIFSIVLIIYLYTKKVKEE